MPTQGHRHTCRSARAMMGLPDNATTTTVGRLIQRFREDEPNSRDARKAMEADCWWVRSQENDLLKRGSRPNAAQHRSCIKPGDERIHPPWLHPHRGEVQSSGSEHGGAALNQSSPLARPPRDISPRQLPVGQLAALELMNDTSQKEHQNLLVPGAGHDAESSRQDEPFRSKYEGESDENAYLDARAHTLLEHCRQLLAPSSTPSDQVSTPASTGLEERARTLLTDCKHSSGRPCIPEAQSKVAKASIGEDSKVSCGGCFGERENTHRFQQEQGNVRHAANVSLVRETEKYSALMTSLLHDVHRAGDRSKHDRSLFRSVLVRNGAEERADWLRDDPALSALLRRFGKIEAEIEKRHSAKLKWRRPGVDLQK